IERPPRVLPRARRELAIRQARSVCDQRRRVAVGLGDLVDDRRQNAIGPLNDRGGPLERARPRLRRRRRFGGRDRRHAVVPASTVSTVPVMLFAFGPSRNSTASATSSTSGSRCSALRRATCSRFSPVIPCVISVSRKPGATAFTVTLSRPTSRASERVKPISDAFVALYTDRPL